MDNYTNDITALSSKGQIVLPKSIRDSLSLKTGSKLMIFTDGENILIKPIKSPDKNEFSNLKEQTENREKEFGRQEIEISKIIKDFHKLKNK